MKLSIFGSCVTRDIFNYDITKEIQLTNYLARSSLATLGAENVSKVISQSNTKMLENIKSSFQCRMVESDFNNGVLNAISNDNYDFIIIDLIDERFNLAIIDNKIVTQSVEFMNSGIKPDRVIKAFSEEFMKNWYAGADNFLKIISATRGLDVIRINKVYWAGIATNEESTSELNRKWSIDRSNECLKLMYKYFENNLPMDSIIEFPEKIFVANPDHIWGLSPFHFDEEYYKEALNKLKSLNKNKK